MDKTILDEYKAINLEIIKALKEDREDISLMEKREAILGKILSAYEDKEELRAHYKELSLKELDEALEKALKEKLEVVKEDIKKLAKSKEANKTYGAMGRPINFFSTNV